MPVAIRKTIPGWSILHIAAGFRPFRQRREKAEQFILYPQKAFPAPQTDRNGGKTFYSRKKACEKLGR
jgi:hypothetical protein